MDREFPIGTDSGAATTAPLDVQVTFTRDTEYVRRLIHDAARPQTWSGALYTAGLLLAAVLCFVSRSGLATLAGLVILVLCACGASAFVLPARRVFDKMGPHMVERCRMAITDDGVTVDSEAASSRLSWRAIIGAQERPYAFLLISHGRTYRDVPRSSLTAEQDEQVRSALIERGLLRPSARPVSAEHARQAG